MIWVRLILLSSIAAAVTTTTGCSTGAWCKVDADIQECWPPISELDCDQPLTGEFLIDSGWGNRMTATITETDVVFEVTDYENPDRERTLSAPVVETQTFCEAILDVPSTDWRVRSDIMDAATGHIEVSTGGEVVERSSYDITEDVSGLAHEPLRSLNPDAYDEFFADE